MIDKMAKTITREDLRFILRISEEGFENEEEEERHDELESIIKGDENLTLIH